MVVFIVEDSVLPWGNALDVLFTIYALALLRIIVEHPSSELWCVSDLKSNR